jgi:hypothetical protein
MKSDLRILQVDKETFRPSPGVHVAMEYVVDGWRARATHERLAGATCTIDSTSADPRCEIPIDRAGRFLERLFSPDFWLFAMTLAFRRRATARASRALAPAA